MVRRRTVALSLSAAALVLAAPLITSCAEHPGSAAVVNGHTISVTELQNRVAQLRHAQSAVGQRVSLGGGDGGVNRMMLAGMIGYQVLDRAAAQHHVTVTPAQIAAARRADEQNVGGPEALRDLLLEKAGTAPGAPTRAYYRDQIQQLGIARAIGADLSTQHGAEQLRSAITRTANAMHIDVNPRFGAWDAVTITGGSSPWLHPAAAPAAQQAALTG